MTDDAKIFKPGDVVVLDEEKMPPLSFHLTVLDSFTNQKGEQVFTAINYHGMYTFFVEDRIGYHFCDEFRVLTPDENEGLMYYLPRMEMNYPRLQGIEESMKKMKNTFTIIVCCMSGIIAVLILLMFFLRGK